MSKTLLTIVGIIAIITVVTAAVFLLSSEDDRQAEIPNQTTQTNQVEVTDETTSEPVAESSVVGSYVDYQQGQTLQSSATNKTVVFFHADWCPTCRFFENDINETGVPNGIIIVKADYDVETELKAQYSVNVQSTFVLLDENGEVEKTWPFSRGLDGINDLYAEINAQ